MSQYRCLRHLQGGPSISTRSSLYWGITGRCQLACRYCFYETGVNPRSNLAVDASHAERIIPSITHCFDQVVLTGGECLLNPSFWEIVRLARTAGLDVSFLTDGILLDTTNVDNVLHHQVSRVAVSLDSLDPKVNESLRPLRNAKRGITNKIVANVTALADRRPSQLQVTVLQTVCLSNIDSILPMIQFCQGLGLDLLVHPTEIPASSTDLDHIRLSSNCGVDIAKLESAMLTWANTHKGRRKYTHVALELIHGRRPNNIMCPMGSKHLFLDVDGSLYPCFHRLDLRIGNVYETELRELLDNAIPKDLRTAPCASLGCACMLE